MPSHWIAPVTLHGRFVRLEPLEAKHAAGLHAAADPKLFVHTSQHPPEWSVRGFELEIASVLALPDTVALAIVLQETGVAIGRTTFMDIRPEHRGVEIGRTWIGRAFHGTRVNPEIKLLMLEHAFETLTPPAIRVQLVTGGTNLHSQAAISKLGAVREGTLRHYRLAPESLPAQLGLVPPRQRDAVFFSILADEWPAVKARLQARLLPGA